jgi:methionine-rich copper-binding protein CopC
VDLKDDRLDPGDPFLMIVSVPKLKAGTYKVIWNAVCLDTHHTTGTFTFTVSGP